MRATYGMPMIVEFGVALDVLVAVLVLGVFFFQIREQFDSLDLHHLESLKESPAFGKSAPPSRSGLFRSIERWRFYCCLALPSLAPSF